MVALTYKEWLAERIKVLRKEIPIHKLLTDCGAELRYDDRPQQISCLFKMNHSNLDKKKSARVFPDEYGYYCYVCTPKPVDVVGFIMVYEGLKFSQAITWLERKYGIDPGEPVLKKELVDELEDILHPKQTKEATVKKLFDYADDCVRRNRDLMPLNDLVNFYWLHDEMLFDFERGKLPEDKAQENLNRLIKKVKSASNPPIQSDRQV